MPFHLGPVPPHLDFTLEPQVRRPKPDPRPSKAARAAAFKRQPRPHPKRSPPGARLVSPADASSSTESLLALAPPPPPQDPWAGAPAPLQAPAAPIWAAEPSPVDGAVLADTWFLRLFGVPPEFTEPPPPPAMPEGSLPATVSDSLFEQASAAAEGLLVEYAEDVAAMQHQYDLGALAACLAMEETWVRSRFLAQEEAHRAPICALWAATALPNAVADRLLAAAAQDYRSLLKSLSVLHLRELDAWGRVRVRDERAIRAQRRERRRDCALFEREEYHLETLFREEPPQPLPAHNLPLPYLHLRQDILDQEEEEAAELYRHLRCLRDRLVLTCADPSSLLLSRIVGMDSIGLCCPPANPPSPFPRAPARVTIAPSLSSLGAIIGSFPLLGLPIGPPVRFYNQGQANGPPPLRTYQDRPIPPPLPPGLVQAKWGLDSPSTRFGRCVLRNTVGPLAWQTSCSDIVFLPGDLLYSLVGATTADGLYPNGDWDLSRVTHLTAGVRRYALGPLQTLASPPHLFQARVVLSFFERPSFSPDAAFRFNPLPDRLKESAHPRPCIQPRSQDWADSIAQIVGATDAATIQHRYNTVAAAADVRFVGRLRQNMVEALTRPVAQCDPVGFLRQLMAAEAAGLAEQGLIRPYCPL